MERLQNSKNCQKVYAEILKHIEDGITVSKIANSTGILIQNVSKELGFLEKYRMIRTEYKSGERGGVKKIIKPSAVWIFDLIAKSFQKTIKPEDAKIIDDFIFGNEKISKLIINSMRSNLENKSMENKITAPIKTFYVLIENWSMIEKQKGFEEFSRVMVKIFPNDFLSIVAKEFFKH
jgi:DNA-binding transcriptional regulator GbsR (MarR family)